MFADNDCTSSLEVLGGTVNCDEEFWTPANPNGVTTVSFVSPDGTAEADGEDHVFSPRANNKLAGRLQSVRWPSSGLTAERFGWIVNLFDLAEGGSTRTITIHAPASTSASRIDAGGTTLVIEWEYQDYSKVLTGYSLSDGKELWTHSGYSLYFVSEDGKTLVTGRSGSNSTGVVIGADIGTGKPRWTINESAWTAMNPDDIGWGNELHDTQITALSSSVGLVHGLPFDINNGNLMGQASFIRFKGSRDMWTDQKTDAILFLADDDEGGGLYVIPSHSLAVPATPIFTKDKMDSLEMEVQDIYDNHIEIKTTDQTLTVDTTGKQVQTGPWLSDMEGAIPPNWTLIKSRGGDNHHYAVTDFSADQLYDDPDIAFGDAALSASTEPSEEYSPSEDDSSGDTGDDSPSSTPAALAKGDSFSRTCAVAWPGKPTYTSDGVQMTMDCGGTASSYPLYIVVYKNKNFSISPGQEVSVTGTVLDPTGADHGVSSPVILASSIS